MQKTKTRTSLVKKKTISGGSRKGSNDPKKSKGTTPLGWELSDWLWGLGPTLRVIVRALNVS